MTRNTANIGNALIAKLGGDPTLLALCPNGVYWDEAPPSATRFVIVSFVSGEDVGVFGGCAYEIGIYLVEARMLQSVGGDINAAAARLDALLQDQPLIAPGYAWMTMYRETYERKVEVDAFDASIRWDRRGGQYRIEMALDAGAVPEAAWAQGGWMQDGGFAQKDLPR